jgi:hypothetical protein
MKLSEGFISLGVEPHSPPNGYLSGNLSVDNKAAVHDNKGKRRARKPGPEAGLFLRKSKARENES